jgi:anti-anti-sigma factor
MFQVETRVGSDGCIIALSGELDLQGVERLTQQLREAQSADGSLTIDLSELEFIDSSGLGVLLRFHNAMVTANRSYRVLPGPPPVHRAFVLTGLDQTLQF